MARLRPNSVSSGSTEMQFDCTEQSPQPSQTAGLIRTRRAGSSGVPRLRRGGVSGAGGAPPQKEDAPRWVFRRAAFAAAALFRGASLHEDDGGSALDLAARLHDRVEFVAVGGPGAGCNLGSRIGLRLFRHQIDLANTLGVKLEGDLLGRQIAVM